jgi:hypothetical protein
LHAIGSLTYNLPIAVSFLITVVIVDCIQFVIGLSKIYASDYDTVDDEKSLSHATYVKMGSAIVIVIKFSILLAWIFRLESSNNISIISIWILINLLNDVSSLVYTDSVLILR